MSWLRQHFRRLFAASQLAQSTSTQFTSLESLRALRAEDVALAGTSKYPNAAATIWSSLRAETIALQETCRVRGVENCQKAPAQLVAVERLQYLKDIPSDIATPTLARGLIEAGQAKRSAVKQWIEGKVM